MSNEQDNFDKQLNIKGNKIKTKNQSKQNESMMIKEEPNWRYDITILKLNCLFYTLKYNCKKEFSISNQSILDGFKTKYHTYFDIKCNQDHKSSLNKYIKSISQLDKDTHIEKENNLEIISKSKLQQIEEYETIIIDIVNQYKQIKKRGRPKCIVNEEERSKNRKEISKLIMHKKYETLKISKLYSISKDELHHLQQLLTNIETLYSTFRPEFKICIDTHIEGAKSVLKKSNQLLFEQAQTNNCSNLHLQLSTIRFIELVYQNNIHSNLSITKVGAITFKDNNSMIFLYDGIDYEFPIICYSLEDGTFVINSNFLLGNFVPHQKDQPICNYLYFNILLDTSVPCIKKGSKIIYGINKNGQFIDQYHSKMIHYRHYLDLETKFAQSFKQTFNCYDFLSYCSKQFDFDEFYQLFDQLKNITLNKKTKSLQPICFTKKYKWIILTTFNGHQNQDIKTDDQAQYNLLELFFSCILTSFNQSVKLEILKDDCELYLDQIDALIYLSNENVSLDLPSSICFMQFQSDFYFSGCKFIKWCSTIEQKIESNKKIKKKDKKDKKTI